ncbi:multiple coagulation factor deficiency protein 2 homolog [Ambystoma mexicanum]|uniref:multiple coagulation factor deficiency protein 2 homolog n=1 Tax=Ambystoma mexicanum TaxID=8296 RepID=UPI0037E9AE6D
MEDASRLAVLWLCFVLAILAASPSKAGGDHEAPAGSAHAMPSDAFHNKSVITDHHHIEEDLKHQIGEIDLETLSEEELEFYYFTLHDFDQNKMLDGLEILAALREGLLHHVGSVFTPEEQLQHYTGMTDEVLEKDDLDQDGFLSYVEYMHSQKRTASPTTILDKSAKDKKGLKNSA